MRIHLFNSNSEATFTIRHGFLLVDLFYLSSCHSSRFRNCSILTFFSLHISNIAETQLRFFPPFFTDSMGHKYFTLNNALPGTIYIGTRSEVISKAVTANKVQNSFSPLLRPLQQDQFSFDMELCDLVTITKGSFVVADREEPQSGYMI